MEKRFSSTDLCALRNLIPIREVIETILCIPSKEVEGVFRFLCPCYRESQTAVNLRTNLSRCFLCKKNFNTIEIFMADRHTSFVKAVSALLPLLPSQIAKDEAATCAGLRQ